MLVLAGTVVVLSLSLAGCPPKHSAGAQNETSAKPQLWYNAVRTLRDSGLADCGGWEIFGNRSANASVPTAG